MTDHAETLILCKLEKWRVESGANPIEVINESIEKGWRGVFLNGHGDGGKLPSMGVQHPAICALCKTPLTTGWIHSRHGRICGKCN